MVEIPGKPLDQLSIAEILKRMADEGKRASEAVYGVLREVERAVELAMGSFARGGRLFYIGAGTSGRLGVLDASECPPTFGTNPRQVQGIIAGGDAALRLSREGAEDNRLAAEGDLERVGLAEVDCLIAISASGTTPYVLEAIGLARARGASTVGITCANNDRFRSCDVLIRLEVGEEILPGSTRLKAGTATKIVLNMISTAALARTGHVWRGLMIGVQPTSSKLRRRAVDIVETLTGISSDQAKKRLEDAGWDVKLALVMQEKQVSSDEGTRLLLEAEGDLGRILD